MKTFNHLFYTGLAIVFLPLFLILIMIVMPLIILERKSEVVEQPRMVIYDTVEVKKVVKIYDTIRPKKIKHVEQKVLEVKVDIDTLINP
jgi:ABC-type Na+ efflux pump permease subunit